ILFFVAVGWLSAERRVTAIDRALHENAELAGKYPPHTRSWRSLGFIVAAIALIGSSVASVSRFFDFRSYEADLVCAREQVCRPHENYWVAPWTDAERSTLSWLRLKEDDRWCVGSAPGWPPGFHGVIRNKFFTDQIERLPKYVCVEGLPHPKLEAK